VSRTRRHRARRAPPLSRRSRSGNVQAAHGARHDKPLDLAGACEDCVAHLAT
jgi:hypothetical protein